MIQLQNVKHSKKHKSHTRKNQKIKKLSQKPIKLCAVSKYSNTSQIEIAYTHGQRLFAESKIQDASKKISLLKEKISDISWHFIGHLQSNKINKALDHFDCIQSVDSLKLLEQINEKAKVKNKKISVYLQVNIAEEKQKFGFSTDHLLQSSPQPYQNITIDGIMIMLPNINDKELLKKTCEKAYKFYLSMQKKIPSIHELSMGMSQDYDCAILAGATMVRIGSAIFKEE